MSDGLDLQTSTEGHIGSTHAWLVLASRSAALCASPVALAHVRVTTSWVRPRAGVVRYTAGAMGADSEIPGPPTGKRNVR